MQVLSYCAPGHEIQLLYSTCTGIATRAVGLHASYATIKDIENICKTPGSVTTDLRKRINGRDISMDLNRHKFFLVSNVYLLCPLTLLLLLLYTLVQLPSSSKTKSSEILQCRISTVLSFKDNLHVYKSIEVTRVHSTTEQRLQKD